MPNKMMQIALANGAKDLQVGDEIRIGADQSGIFRVSGLLLTDYDHEIHINYGKPNSGCIGKYTVPLADLLLLSRADTTVWREFVMPTRDYCTPYAPAHLD